MPAWPKPLIPSIDWLAHYERKHLPGGALTTLTDPRARLQDAGIELYLTEGKGPVMDRLANTEFLEQFGHDRVFLTTQEVYEKLVSLHPPQR